jgi:hypothetical protein
MKTGIALVILFTSVVSFAQERSWKSFEVPDAYCGAGDPYRIFVSQGDPQKVAFAFQGGGACWGADSCYGWIQTADMNGYKTVSESGGIFSANATVSPISDYTMVYFPYCTGDVFAGRHTAVYENQIANHTGADNVEKSFNYLLSEMPTMFQKLENLAVYGYSAGAIGAIVHIRNIDRLFGYGVPNKAAVFDAPGLHWGDTFWLKFTDELNSDYEMALTAAGLRWNKHSGLIAEIIPATCHALGDWNIGVLQSTRDRIMSLVFGDTTPVDHEARVLGVGGIQDLTKDPTDNCMAYSPPTTNHTMLRKDKGNLPSIGGIFPMQFAGSVFSQQKVANLK